MVQSEYWCSPATSTVKIYNRWMSSDVTRFCDPLKNDILSEFIKGGREWGWRVEDISNLLRNGRRGPEVIVADRYKGRRGSKKGQIEHSLTVERSLIISCWSRATKISKVYLIFWNLTLSCIILKNWPILLWKYYVLVHTARFLTYVWPFFNIMHEMG